MSAESCAGAHVPDYGPLQLLRGKPLLFVGDSEVRGNFETMCQFLGGVKERIPGSLSKCGDGPTSDATHGDARCR